MQSAVETVDKYVAMVPNDRKAALTKLRQAILNNLPPGFEETMNYGMIGYVVPHSLYPAGYHCDPQLPLPFMNLGSRKNYLAVYHMGIYGMESLHSWLTEEYKKRCHKRPDMGKSCIRFKKIDSIPFTLIGDLAGKITVEEWIFFYESAIKRDGKG